MSGIREKHLISKIGILFLFFILISSCSRPYYIEPIEIIEYGGVNFGELGDLIVVVDSNDLIENIIVVDTTYGINIYDSTGQLLSYYNEAGIGKLEFSLGIIRSGKSMDLIIGYLISDGSVICYEWDRNNQQLKAILQFSQHGLSEANNYCDASRNDSLQLLFTARDSTLTRWAFVFDDSLSTSISFIEQEKLDFEPIFVSFNNRSKIELIDSEGKWYSKENEQKPILNVGKKDWLKRAKTKRENENIFYSGTNNTLYITDNKKVVKHKVKLINSSDTELKRLKTIALYDNKVIAAGEFYNKELKKFYIGILIGIQKEEK